MKPWLPGGGAIHSDDPHDDPVVVYRTVAILLAALAIALLVIPVDWVASGGPARDLANAIVAAVGEPAARLLFAIPCGVLAFLSGRMGWGSHGE